MRLFGAALAASLMLASPLALTLMMTAARRRRATRSASVKFPNSCSEARAGEAHARRRAAAFLLVQESGKTFREVLAQDPSCAIAALGHRLDLDGQPARRAGRLARRRRRPRWRPSRRRAPSARKPSASATTSTRSPPITRTSPIAPSATGSSRAESLRGARCEIPEGRRGADLLRAVPQRARSRSPTRPTPRSQGGGDPGAAVQEVPGPSRRRALPDP